MENPNVLILNIDTKNAESIRDIEASILEAFGASSDCLHSFDCFSDHMRDIMLDSNIDNVIINIKEPKNHKNNKNIKKQTIPKERLIEFKEDLNNIIIPEFIETKRRNIQINWV